MSLPTPLQKIADATLGTPFEGQVWLVGGAVRDEILGVETKDYDLVTELNALDLCQFLLERGVAEKEPQIYPRFGTAMILVEGYDVELITARKESYRSDSRKPIKVEPGTLLEDAKRRDLTMNSLLKNLHTGEIYDPTGFGLGDLKNGILRTPDEPERMIDEDPLRMLRIVRFHARFGFRYAEGLRELIRERAWRLEIISAERIQEEFSRMLLLRDPACAVRELRELGLLKVFAPELDAMHGVEQGKWHQADVFEHTMHVLNGTRADLVLRMAALLHDVGKPETKIIKEGEIRFFSHEVVGAAITKRFLKRLRYSTEFIDQVSLLVKNHMRLGSMEQFSAPAARRLLRDLRGHEELLFELVQADVDSLRNVPKKIDVNAIRQRIHEVATVTPRNSLASPLTGEEIMKALGIGPGEVVGKWKNALEEQVLEGTFGPGDKKAALEWLFRESKI